MRVKHTHRRTLLCSVAFGALSITGAAWAQEDTTEDEDAVIELIEEEEDEARQEKIIVTGSRLRRDEFTSASPLKVLNVEESVAAGLVDTAAIVQRTSVAGGTQFDSTFTGIPTNGGAGAANVSLRGLDAERTLILSDGRRLAPSGVAGSPTRPDLNLIPLGMVERVDVLTDGASSIYGADAVAGVINFVTRKDFDGVEIDTFLSQPEAGGGTERRISIATGLTADKGNFAFGAEYYNRDQVRRGEREFTPCIRDIEVNPETGERREICINGNFSNMFLDPANLFFGADLLGDGLGPDFGIYGFDFDNGAGFTLIPSNFQAGAPGDIIGSDWLYDERYNANATNDRFELAQGIDRYSFFTNGEYNIGIAGNANVYFEGLYAKREQRIFTGGSQVFPSVPCSNPFIEDDPVLSQTTVCNEDLPFRGILEPLGLAQLIWLPRLVDQSGPAEVDVATSRGVLGISGDLEGLIPTGKYVTGSENFGLNLGNWSYDVWGSFDSNTGLNRQRTLNEERIFASIVTAERQPDGSITCGIDGLDGDLFGFISAETCVPIDITDPNVFLNGVLPQEAFDYVSGLSQQTTTIQQQMLQGTITGDFAKLPGGTVPVSLGVEFRKDNIETLNSFLITSASGTDGNSEGNTIGSTSLLEFFGETELPVIKGAPAAEELTFNLSARWTEEENFGALWTYRLQGIYKPVDWITARASVGTTYRAPNLREQFLAQQVAFFSAFADPCVNAAFTSIDDELQPIVEANCNLQGADPNTLGVGGAVSPKVVVGGNGQLLNAETSDGLTAGIVIEQPWFDSFDLSVALGYFNIEIEDSIEEPNVGFILNECLVNSTNLSSPFCQLIVRDTNVSDPSRNFINFVNASFFNVGLIETDGMDLDIRYSQEVPFYGNELTIDSNFSGSFVFKNKRDAFDIVESFDGRPYLPHFRGDLQTAIGYRDFTFNWNAVYIGETQDDDIDALRATDVVDPRDGTVFFAEGFRDVEETDEYIQHDFSLEYEQDTWGVSVGVRNAFDEQPKLVDEGEGYFTSANAVIGAGYDVFGRTFFARLRKEF